MFQTSLEKLWRSIKLFPSIPNFYLFWMKRGNKDDVVLFSLDFRCFTMSIFCWALKPVQDCWNLVQNYPPEKLTINFFLTYHHIKWSSNEQHKQARFKHDTLKYHKSHYLITVLYNQRVISYYCVCGCDVILF